jgi:hypothetical protein
MSLDFSLLDFFAVSMAGTEIREAVHIICMPLGIV